MRTLSPRLPPPLRSRKNRTAMPWLAPPPTRRLRCRLPAAPPTRPAARPPRPRSPPPCPPRPAPPQPAMRARRTAHRDRHRRHCGALAGYATPSRVPRCRPLPRLRTRSWRGRDGSAELPGRRGVGAGRTSAMAAVVACAVARSAELSTLPLTAGGAAPPVGSARSLLTSISACRHSCSGHAGSGATSHRCSTTQPSLLQGQDLREGPQTCAAALIEGRSGSQGTRWLAGPTHLRQLALQRADRGVDAGAQQPSRLARPRRRRRRRRRREAAGLAPTLRRCLHRGVAARPAAHGCVWHDTISSGAKLRQM
jgi:hypothetical protein